MHLLRKSDVQEALLVQLFRQKMKERDPIGMAPDVIRENILALANQAGVTEEEAREIARIVIEKLSPNTKELLAALNERHPTD